MILSAIEAKSHQDSIFNIKTYDFTGVRLNFNEFREGNAMPGGNMNELTTKVRVKACNRNG